MPLRRHSFSRRQKRSRLNTYTWRLCVRQEARLSLCRLHLLDSDNYRVESAFEKRVPRRDDEAVHTHEFFLIRWKKNLDHITHCTHDDYFLSFIFRAKKTLFLGNGENSICSYICVSNRKEEPTGLIYVVSPVYIRCWFFPNSFFPCGLNR